MKDGKVSKWESLRWWLRMAVGIVGGIIAGVIGAFFIGRGEDKWWKKAKADAKQARKEKEDELEKMSDSDVIDTLRNADDVGRIARHGDSTSSSSTELYRDKREDGSIFR